MSKFDNIIRRRMKNTGETYEQAKAAVTEIASTIKGEASSGPEGWVDNWLALGIPPQWAVDRLLNDTSAWPLARRFPPLCLVRSRPGCHFMVPADGGVAIVIGYDSQNESLKLLAYPQAKFAAFATAQDLEVIGFHEGRTLEWVAKVLGS